MILPSLHSIMHAAMGIVGVLANLLLIAAIILSRKNTYLLTYSLLLFNTAVTDLVACVADLMTMLRIVVDSVSLAYIYHGPCGQISPSACHFFFGLMMHFSMHSIALIAISFWYRAVAVSRPTPSALRLQLLCLAVLAPTLLKHIDFLWAMSSQEDALEILHRVYPDMDATNLVIAGQHSTIGPHSSAIYISILPTVAYSVIIIMRRKVIRKIAGNTTMSKKTKTMHETLVRALTIHAFLPISLCSGVAAFLLLTAGVPRSEMLEHFGTMGLTFPSAGNPILTLYFVAPLRNSILRPLKKILHEKSSVSSVRTVTNVSMNKLPSIH